MYQKDPWDNEMLQPTSAAMLDFLPPAAYPHLPATSFATKFVHVSTNKIPHGRQRGAVHARRPPSPDVFPERRVHDVERHVFQLRDDPAGAQLRHPRSRVLPQRKLAHLGDDAGTLKYWQTNLNNLKSISGAHSEPVRGVAFASTDLKFCSCSDDTTVKVWDFARAQMTSALTGHGGDVKSVDWHPRQALLASGGKDSLVKLWDAKSGSAAATIHAHKNQVGCVKWNQNGNWLVSGCRGSQVKVFDVRTLAKFPTSEGTRRR